MFINSKKERTENLLLSVCPCADILGGREQLSPLCFLGFLKTLNHNLIKSDETIKPEQVMFCLDAESIFSNQYSADLVRKTGASGFGHITKSNIISVMNSLYWFRKHNSEFKLSKLIESNTTNFKRFVMCLKQTLHTVNGLIIKKIDCFGPEIVSYHLIAKQTAMLFRDLFSEYIARGRDDISLEALPPIFAELKEFFGFVKQNHEHVNVETRKSILSYNFKNKTLGRFFGTEFRRLTSYINRRVIDGTGDYTCSLAWDYRCTMLCQTRNLGYLPYYLMREKAREFWKTVSRETIEVDPRKLEQVKQLVWDELELSGLERNALALDKGRYEPLIKDSVRLELKATASTDRTVSAGGKLEDARIILSEIRLHKIRIPIRDLETFKITGFTPMLTKPEEDVGGINTSSILFWFSLQTVINRLSKVGEWAEGDSFTLPSSLCHYQDDLLQTTLICINEPGKARMLVKSMSNFNWALVPAAKICQKILAELPEHKAGLSLGSHDWQHAKRIGGESMEATFMYENDSGALKPTIIMGFMDWTEATDSMARQIGIAHLLSFWGYIGFPRRYAQLIGALLTLPQPVREFLTLENEDGDPERFEIKGTINEGFMMGNQMTKTILHLSHLSQRNLCEKYLNYKGIVVRRAPPGVRRRPFARMKRTIERATLSTFK